MTRQTNDLIGNSVRLLLDTQILVWLTTGDPRLSPRRREAILDSGVDLCVSVLTAFELTDLQLRGRILISESIALLSSAIGFSLIDFPAEAWSVASTLPDIHRDPVDRMLVAHAIIADMTLVTADAKMQRYPVKALW